ncbi:MAG TPA: NADH-quinone oxidoreductase subunit L [Aggregatilineales bacterium]|nr:NADH-quinone oxidoreductase subunit L [Anaerolineales bacterium]HRE47149.1 NADH-quinone oxidoreductase subunit L [Aggregatilineales bacterium]
MNWFDANNLPWLIPVPPLVAFMVILLFAGRNRLLTHITAIGAMGLSLVMSLSVVLRAVQFPTLGKERIFGSGIDWLANSVGGAGSGALSMGVAVDPLTVALLFMVPIACLMIFIYSLGYMAHDKRNPRFFAYLSLFAGAMLTLVVADNLLMLFVGWEVMGLCSYLLIGFWYDRAPQDEVDGVAPYQAAIKAFMTTRVADVIFMIGIAYLWATTGTLNFRTIFFSEETMSGLAATPAVGGFLGLSAAGLIGICVFIGTVGKSAQFPLHVWLPDAMKGPTPVSAMIHAAAMVSAGIYLLLRMYPILSVGSHVEDGILSSPMVAMAVIGAITAVFAATIAVAQNDIKKVLAYSTISQLGFMVAALGVGGYAAAAFHLITHAFFKALLFMGSGSVIHAMEHGHHVAHGAHGHGDDHSEDHQATAHADHGHGEGEHAAHGHGDSHEEHAAHGEVFDPQDMRNMGGLLRNMPVTGITFVIGGAALAGFPLVTAGFWSKDEILAEAWAAMSHTPIGLFVLVCLAAAAILTAFYTMRQIAMTFLGSPRTEAAIHAKHYDPARGDGPTERGVSVTMTFPLIILAGFALIAGFVGVNPSFPIVGPVLSGFGIEKPFIKYIGYTLPEAPHLPDFNILPVLLSFTVFGLGAYAGYALYIRRPVVLGEPDPVEGIVGEGTYRLLKNKYFIDEFYQAYFIKPVRWFSDKVAATILDQGVIDGVIHFFARLAGRIGDVFKEFNRVVIDGVGDGIPEAIADAAKGLRPLQTGRVQQYLLFALIAALIVGLNLAVASVAPNAIPIFIIIQGAIAIAIVMIFGNTGDKTQPSDSGD